MGNSVIKIAAVGDIFLGDQPICFGFGVMSKAKIKGYDYLFRHVKDVFSRLDLVIGNLESVIGDPLPDESYNLWSMMNRSTNAAARALKNSGVNLVSLPNNHIFEHNEYGLAKTIENLEEIGIIHIGSKKRPVYVYEKDNRRIGFIAWSLLPDRYWPDKDPKKYYNITDDISDIVNEAKAVKDRVDYLVLSLHWGNEFIQQPSKRQQCQAHLLVDSGVDVIFCHHPHVLQPVERYRHGLIFYSLGNFIFDYWPLPCKQSVIVELHVSNELTYKLIPVISSEDYVPILCKNKSTAGEILKSMENDNFMDDEIYDMTLHKKRQEYRFSAFFHFSRNFYRYDKKNIFRFIKWALKRVIYIYKIRKLEKEQPNLIYEGPMKG